MEGLSVWVRIPIDRFHFTPGPHWFFESLRSGGTVRHDMYRVFHLMQDGACGVKGRQPSIAR